MSEEKDGGPAFPPHEAAFEFIGVQTGMTLRDWFAGQALAGGITGDNSPDYTIDEMADDAYRIADAMLVRRAKAEGR